MWVWDPTSGTDRPVEGMPIDNSRGSALKVANVGPTGEAINDPVTYTNRSGTITLGGTAQTLAAANTARRGFWIQNLSTGDLWISSLGTAAATQPSLRIQAGALYESPEGGVPAAAISIFGGVTGQAFSAREW